MDNSIVTLTPNNINANAKPNVTNSYTSTQFTFPAPVYVRSGVTYAFVLQSPSVEYNIWIAAQSDIALASSVGSNNSTTKITTVPYTGQLFETQNSGAWSGDPTKSIMFVINRCDFSTSANPSIPFVVASGSALQKYVSQDLTAYYSTHDFSAQSTTSYYGTALINNSKNFVTTIDNEMDAFNITTTDFIPTNTNISYSYRAQLQSTYAFDTVKPVSPGRLAAPNYENEILADGQGPRLLQANSSNSFTLYANLSTTDSTISPIIADDGTTLFNIQWLINNLPLSNNQISVAYGGGGGTNPYTQATTTATVSAPDIPGGVQANVAVIVANGQVKSVYVTNPGSGYLNTPVINVVDSNTIPGTGARVVVTSEFTPTGGNAETRYITKPITLTDTNASGDLRLFFTAYRPSPCIVEKISRT